MLRRSAREPSQGEREVSIRMTALLSLSSSDQTTEIDEGREYWAIYQSSAGEWWYTINPTRRSEDLTVKRVRSRRWGTLTRHERQLAKKAGGARRCSAT